MPVSTLPSELSVLLATSHLGVAPLTWIPATEIPQPYQKLLVHDVVDHSHGGISHRKHVSAVAGQQAGGVEQG